MKGWFSVLFIDGFRGGRLTVNAQFGVMFMSHQIKPDGHGNLVITDRFHGPKEWSPHGTVPKTWMEIYRFKDPCREISVSFLEQGGTEKRYYWTLKPREGGVQGIYFAPGTGTAGELPISKKPGRSR